MDRNRTSSGPSRPRPAYVPGDFGAPTLLLVSVAAAGFAVAAIILVALIGEGWAVVVALLAALAATAAVIGFIVKMLADADPSR